MKEKTTLGSKILSLTFAVLSVFWLIPIFLTLINSFKSNNFVNLEAFALPNSESFVGWANYIKGMTFDPNHPFWEAAFFSFFITVASVLLILLFCSMTAWYIVRVKSKGANRQTIAARGDLLAGGQGCIIFLGQSVFSQRRLVQLRNRPKEQHPRRMLTAPCHQVAKVCSGTWQRLLRRRPDVHRDEIGQCTRQLERAAAAARKLGQAARLCSFLHIYIVY
jgi:hypothetical protein